MRKALYLIIGFLLISFSHAATISLTNGVSIWNFNTTLNKTDYYKLNNLTATGSVTQVSTPIDYGQTIKTINYTDYNGLTAADSTSLSITGNLTIIVTVKANSLSSSREGFLVGKYTYPSSQRAYKLTSDSPAGSCLGNLSFTISNTAASYNGSRLCSNTPLPKDGAYHTVIATFEKTKGMNLYLDGVNVSAPNGTSGTVIDVLAGIADSTAVLGIGNDGYNRDICNCTFEEVAILSRVITPAEVTAYNGNITALRGILDAPGAPAPTTTTYYIGKNETLSTIAQANALSLDPGDSVLFRRGDRWDLLYEGIDSITDTSGDATGNITYGAYGTGNKPIFTRSYHANSTTNWTDSGSNRWNTSFTISDDVGLLIFNNEASWGTKVSTFAAVDSQGEFYYDTATDKVSLYSVGNPATFYTQIEVSKKGNIFDLSSAKNILIKDLDLRYSAKHGVFTQDSNNIYLDGVNMSFIGGAYQSGTLRYGNGVDFEGNQENLSVYNCSFYQIYDAAMSNQDQTDATHNNIRYSYNKVSNARYCYEVINKGTNAVTTNILIDQNTCFYSGYSFGAQSEGYAWRSGQTRNNVRNFNVTNNIFYISKTDAVLIDDIFNTSFIKFANNLYFQNSSSDDLINWQSSTYTLSQFATYQAAKSQDTNSQATTTNFLTSGSLVPAAASVACTMSETGAYVGALPCSSSTTCSGSSFDLADNCVINSAITSGNITFTGIGSWYCNATIGANITFLKSYGCNFFIKSTCKITGKVN